MYITVTLLGDQRARGYLSHPAALSQGYKYSQDPVSYSADP